MDADGNPASLKLPEAATKTWYHHPVHGADFRKAVDNLTEKFGKPDEVMKKRASDSQISNVVPKKLRLDLSWLPLQDQAGEETQKAGLFRAQGSESEL